MSELPTHLKPEQDGLLLAAEFVLGTLSARDRAVVMEYRAADERFDRLVRDLERELSRLLLLVPRVAPPEDLRAAVLARISDVSSVDAAMTPQEDERFDAMRRSRSRWRLASMLIGLLALGLAGGLEVMTLGKGRTREGIYVATLEQSGGVPAFVALVDANSDEIVVRRVGIGAPEDKAYELWATGGEQGAPISLGVVKDQLSIPLSRLEGAHISLLSDTTLSISLEPPAGSPTGQPTGPVAYIGKLVAIEK